MLGFGAVTFALLIAQGIILFTLINTNLTAKINKELDNTLETDNPDGQRNNHEFHEGISARHRGKKQGSDTKLL